MQIQVSTPAFLIYAYTLKDYIEFILILNGTIRSDCQSSQYYYISAVLILSLGTLIFSIKFILILRLLLYL